MFSQKKKSAAYPPPSESTFFSKSTKLTYIHAALLVVLDQVVLGQEAEAAMLLQIQQEKQKYNISAAGSAEKIGTRAYLGTSGR